MFPDQNQETFLTLVYILFKQSSLFYTEALRYLAYFIKWLKHKIIKTWIKCLLDTKNL